MTIPEQVFLAERAVDRNYQLNVIRFAQEINVGVFNEQDPQQQLEVSTAFVKKETNNSASDVIDIVMAVDANKGKPGFEKVVELRDCFADGLYLAMRDGQDSSSDFPYRDILMTGSENQISGVLPTPFKALAREVSLKVIDNADIIAIINEVDSVSMANLWPEIEPSDDDRTATFKQAEDKLRKMIPTIGVGKPQVILALKYVVAMKNGGLGAKTGEASYLKSMADESEALARERKIRSEAALKDLLSSYLAIRATTEQRKIHTWETSPPEWARMFSKDEWSDLLSTQDSLVAGVNSKRRGAEYASFDNIKKSALSTMTDMSEADFKKWSDDPRIKLQDVMGVVARELLVPEIIKTRIDGKDVTSKIFVFETREGADGKKEYVNSRVNEFVLNQTDYKVALAERLVTQSLAVNIEIAKLQVAMAMDVMELGGVFSVADTLRALGWESESVRFAQRPITKVEPKIGGNEIIMGNLGVYAKSITETDSQAMDLLNKMGVVPDLLCGAFWDIKNKTTGKSMAEEIYVGNNIDYKVGYGGILFGWRKDHLVPACDVMMYLTGDKDLNISRVAEVDNTVTKWMGSIRNSLNALRGNGVSLVPTEVICGAIASATNLYPIPGPYLRIAEPGPKFLSDYRTVGSLILDGLILTDRERDDIQKYFSLNYAGAIAANVAVNFYNFKVLTGIKVKKSQK